MIKDRAIDPPPGEQCCEPWLAAQIDGTDNEGYHSLLRYGVAVKLDGIGWEMGFGDLPFIQFCPWCGAPKKGRTRPRLGASDTTGNR